MSETAQVRLLSYCPGKQRDLESGLIGWISIRLPPLVVDGIALRRGHDGHFFLSFPERRDSAGRRHSVVFPPNREARKAIESAVFRDLGLPGHVGDAR